jgi:DNA invertase Pin-like site-specific DNA recombinase
MAVIGYARVSTSDQNLDLQLDALKAAGASSIYEEHCSGAALERPELVQCLKALRPGDTLVVWRLDRLGRNLRGLIEAVNDLEERDIAFRSITEAIDTSGPTGRLVFHIFAALAQFERELLRERTMSGLAAARARGRKGGRPRALSPGDVKAVVAMMRDPHISVGEIARRFNVSRSTLHNYVTRGAASQP